MTYIKSRIKTNNIMTNLLIALVPIIMFAFFKNGVIPYANGYISLNEMFYPLIIIATGTLTSFIIEVIYCLIFRKKIKNQYSFFPGLFFSLLMTINTPLYIVILGSSIATILGKLMFKGFGKNIFNPALVGYIIIIIFFGSSLGSYANNYEIDTISSSTPLTNASIQDNLGSYQTLVEPYGNYANILFGFTPGALGEVNSFFIIAAFIFLTVTKSIKWRITASYLTTVFIIMVIVSRIAGINIDYPLFQLLTGGLLFGAVFMATDPVTSAVTPLGQIIQGVLLGILTSILRFTGIEGVAYSILIINAFVFIYDYFGEKARSNNTICITICTLFSILIIVVGILLKILFVSDSPTDPNFEIISKEKNGDSTVYIVTQKGYGGKIKAEITINEIITNVELLNHNESKNQFQLVLDADYINTLIKNQENINDTDTVSGATVSSTALKKMLINTLENYK